jgi:xanthine dehydrogenase accessory factor
MSMIRKSATNAKRLRGDPAAKDNMMTAHVEVMDLVAEMKAAEQAFVLATVVRTVSVTAAKAGAKAIIRPDGAIVAGWIGGGCARGAVLKAAREALADGEPRMVSVQPENLLAELGVKPGETREGVRFASNMCPSKGTMDIFVEPVLPHPSLIILGASPVAMSLAAQARTLGYHVTLAAPAADVPAEPDADERIDGFQFGELNEAKRFIVVSTQGKGDEAALRAAVAIDACYHAFVGSRRKMASLRAKLIGEGVESSLVDRVKAPAGLDLGAITPEEIAMSILAEITIERRRGQRLPVSV